MTVSGIHIPLVASRNIELKEFNDLSSFHRFIDSVPFANLDYVEVSMAEDVSCKLTCESFLTSENALKITDAHNLEGFSTGSESNVLDLPLPQFIEAILPRGGRARKLTVRSHNTVSRTFTQSFIWN